MSHEDILKQSLERALEQEKKARNRSFFYTLVPILVAIALIWFTWTQVAEAQKQLDNTNARLNEANTVLTQSQTEMSNLEAQLAEANRNLEELGIQADQLQKRVAELQAQQQKYQTEINDLEIRRNELEMAIDSLGAQFDESNTLQRYVYEGNLWLLLKGIPLNPAQADVLTEILTAQDQDLRFLPGGIGPERFDSPGFAAFILTKYKLVPGGPDEMHYSLPATLPKIAKPGILDIIFYESGYTMFYLEDSAGHEVVIGMTPVGIVALNYDFAAVLAIGDVNYRE